MGKSERNYGIDLLRVVSMLFVIMLHIMGHGGVLASTGTYWHFSAAWLLETIAYPAVNCFVLISGFVGYRGEKHMPRLKNIFSIFFTVLFYSGLICLLFQWISPASVDMQDIKNAFSPILKNQYWFFTSYVGMFLLSPMLNLLVDKATAKQNFLFALTVFFFSIAGMRTTAFVLNSGYSMLWFSFMYLLGAILKKYDVCQKVSAKHCVLLLAAALFLSWLVKAASPLVNKPFVTELAADLISYTSPTVVLMAVGWLCLFSKLPHGRFWQVVLPFFSTSAFSVYLIHDNIHVRVHVMQDFFRFANQYPAVLMVGIVIGSAVAILFACTLLDKIRVLLFRVVRVDAFAQLLEKVIKKAVNAAYAKLHA